MPSLVLGEDDFRLDEASLAEFLAECATAEGSTSLELGSAATSVGCTSSSSSSHQETKRKPWRQRRKEEIECLREEVKQLSAHLDNLKLIARTHQDSTSSSPIKSQSEVCAWETIAAHQFKLCQVSEEENVKLREEVKNRRQQARAFKCVFKRKFRTAMKSPVVGLYKRYQLDASTVRPPSDNQAVFDELKEGMDTIYAHLDAFFRRVGMDKLPCPGRRNTSMINNAQDMAVEFLDKYAFPFDLRQTESVIWKLEDPRAEDPMGVFFLENFSEGDNTRMKSMSFPFTMDSINFRIVIRRVTKKYAEDDRTVFITRSLVESVIGLTSIELVETTRMVLNRGKPSLVGPVTKMQTYREAAVRGNVFTSDVTGFPSVEDGLKIWEGGVERFKYRVEDQLMRPAS